MEVMSLNTKVEADREAYELNSRKYEEGLITLIDRQALRQHLLLLASVATAEADALYIEK